MILNIESVALMGYIVTFLLVGFQYERRRGTSGHALEIIERNAKLQAHLVEDLLDVSRILRGQFSLDLYSVDLVIPIETALETVRLTAEEKSIELKFSIVDERLDDPENDIAGESKISSHEPQSKTLQPAVLQPETLTVLGDGNRLQQIVWNLLSNAIKFTAAGGKIEVTLRRIKDYAQIIVTDTGKGISPDFLPYVFERFRQADEATTRHFGGLGLGVAIVRHLVELHGGSVQADSLGEGLGATFTVTLPLVRTLYRLDFNNI
jgi:signal transduction histidine kinase